MKDSGLDQAIGKGFYAPDEAKITQLQTILAAESGNTVSFSDAEEVGIQLVSLYECLARERGNTEDRYK